MYVPDMSLDKEKPTAMERHKHGHTHACTHTDHTDTSFQILKKRNFAHIYQEKYSFTKSRSLSFTTNLGERLVISPKTCLYSSSGYKYQTSESFNLIALAQTRLIMIK